MALTAAGSEPALERGAPTPRGVASFQLFISVGRDTFCATPEGQQADPARSASRRIRPATQSGAHGMSMLELHGPARTTPRAPVPQSDLDLALTAQLVVAWAGERGDEPRLGWWRCDLASEFGGEDLFRRLLPATWPWATLQAAREAARRCDARLRSQDHDPDRIISLYHLGPEYDERIDERLQDLKRAGQHPGEALPGLDVITHDWRPVRFAEWLDAHGPAEATAAPIGRRLKGDLPPRLDQRVRKLVAALAPPGDAYPLPHYRRAA